MTVAIAANIVGTSTIKMIAIDMTKATATIAIVNLLRRIDAKPDQRIDLYQVGIDLIMEAEDKYTQEDVLSGLLYLESLKVIEISDNCLKVIRPLTEADKVLRQISL